MKLLNFENWSSGELSKIGHYFKEDSTLDPLAYFSYIFISGKNVVIAAGCLNNMTYRKKKVKLKIDFFNLF